MKYCLSSYLAIKPAITICVMDTYRLSRKDRITDPKKVLSTDILDLVDIWDMNGVDVTYSHSIPSFSTLFGIRVTS